MRAQGKLHRTFCENLRAARKAAGLTQWQAAEKLEISQPRYAEIEMGKHPPGLELIERLAKLFHVKAHELLDPDFSRVMAAA